MPKPMKINPTKTVQSAAEQPEESYFQSMASLCGTLIVGLFVLTFVFQNFMIPSASMASTLLVGDHVVVDRASLAPSANWSPLVPYRPLRRGEPVVFYKPLLEANGEELIMVKRVVGVPGDRIHLRRGIVYLNGIAQNEAQAAKPTHENYNPYRDDFPSLSGVGVPGVTSAWSVDLPNHVDGDDLVVPPDSYFVLGDNRTNSLDGRYWGFVPRASLIGRPLFVYWSFETPQDGPEATSTGDQVKLTVYEFLHVFDRTRWKRTLHQIN